ncbi:uncharacterized protein [Rutidosis leptorrhynchoides]|uniref:uncharacterized protein n=1 Tax=Rutidosis leptorrhynchoides TaxID=125765 RepID=UPI003A99BEF1
MVWIGIYIAVASFLCIVAMGADLLHGFRNKKMWFPSKYFTLNAASITVITVTMKLPVDLNSMMPRYVDQSTKLGSMAFMCTMMANLMPSLASMDNNTLLANVIVIDDVHEDIKNYVLQLEDEMELGDRMLNHISNTMDNLIQKTNKEQNKDLLVFLDTSTGFNGVKNFDSDQVEDVTSVKVVNSWSIPVVTLTCIAISLPNIPKKNVDRLLKNVREGLLYTHQVEEIINNTSEYGNIQKAAMTLWHEVEEKYSWLKNPIKKGSFKGKTSVEILEWFANKGKEIVLEINKSTNGEVIMVNTRKKLILANSMYRTARTILYDNQINDEKISEQELFALLCSMIADILSACFTNIPRVIKMKCRESDIEKRESSVKAATKLFGRTEDMLKRLEARESPNMDPEKMVFIDEWRHHLKLSIP